MLDWPFLGCNDTCTHGFKKEEVYKRKKSMQREGLLKKRKRIEKLLIRLFELLDVAMP